MTLAHLRKIAHTHKHTLFNATNLIQISLSLLNPGKEFSDCWSVMMVFIPDVLSHKSNDKSPQKMWEVCECVGVSEDESK